MKIENNNLLPVAADLSTARKRTQNSTNKTVSNSDDIYNIGLEMITRSDMGPKKGGTDDCTNRQTDTCRQTVTCNNQTCINCTQTDDACHQTDNTFCQQTRCSC